MSARFSAYGHWLSLVVLAGVACSSESGSPPVGGGFGGSAGSGGQPPGGSASMAGSAGTAAVGGSASAGTTSVGGSAPGVAGSGSGGGGTSAGSGGSGGAPGKGYQKTITLDTSATGANVTANVDKYPLAIQLDATNFDFAQADAMGKDVRFEKSDGTALPHSIEHWDSVGKTAALWVKLDQVVGNMAGQTLRMVWGAGPTTADSKAVFSTADGFYGVWHLDEEGNTEAGGYKDASSHEAHGTGIALSPGTRVNARVGKGVDLKNAVKAEDARWIRVEGEKASAYNPTADRAITVSVWALAHSYPLYSYETIMSKGDTSWSLQRVQYEDTGYQSCLLAGGQPGYHFCVYNFEKHPRVTEQWLHFMLVLDQPEMTLYINGELSRSGTGTGWNQGDHPLGIGNQTQILTANREWDGILDEPRVMQAAKTVSWAKLDFETQRAMQKAVTYGASEPRP